MKNSNKSSQMDKNQQPGIQNHGKNPTSGMKGGSKIKTQGQGSVAGSTGTGNQGKVGNPVSGQ